MKLAGTALGVDWAVMQRPLPGQRVCGDHYVVAPIADGLLLAVIDGLGHGPDAALAAQVAADSLAGTPEAGPAELIRSCHEALRGTRGAVLTLAVYRPRQAVLEWVGVGNVDCIFWHRPGHPDASRESVVPRGGVVGYELPRLHVSTTAVAPGDICCLVSDGIVSAFAEKTPAYLDPLRLAEYILGRYARASDDALVLTARFGEATA